MTPDDRSPDLKPSAAGPPLPAPSNSTAARADAIAVRVDELIALDGLAPAAAARRAYLDLSAETQPPLPAAAKVILGLIAAAVLAVAIPGIGYLIGWLIPVWRQAFAWL